MHGRANFNEGRVCFSVKELAEALGCSVRLVQKEIYEGRLSAFKIGRRLMIANQHVQDYIEKQRVKHLPPDRVAAQYFQEAQASRKSRKRNAS